MGVARVPKIWGCWDPAPLGQRVRVADPYQYAILRLCYPAKFVRSGSNGTSICLLTEVSRKNLNLAQIIASEYKWYLPIHSSYIIYSAAICIAV